MRGRIQAKVRRIYERAIEEELRRMPGDCNLWLASGIAKKAAPDLRDPRTGIGYVRRVAKRTEGIKIREVGGISIGHKNSPSTYVDEECLEKCAQAPIGIASFLCLSDEAIERSLNKACRCRCVGHAHR